MGASYMHVDGCRDVLLTFARLFPRQTLKVWVGYYGPFDVALCFIWSQCGRRRYAIICRSPYCVFLCIETGGRLLSPFGGRSAALTFSDLSQKLHWTVGYMQGIWYTGGVRFLASPMPRPHACPPVG
jgi:hypothetical protein